MAAPSAVSRVSGLHQPPTGTVTFLSTDIDVSTRLWEERAGEMRSANTTRSFRSAIEADGGYVFSTGGDGFAFARLDAVSVTADETARPTVTHHGTVLNDGGYRRC